MTSENSKKSMPKKAAKVMHKMVKKIHLQPKEEVEALVAQTEATLNALIAELKRRNEDEQHQSIENLDDHLKEADTSFKRLRHFITMALDQINK
ncbi:MAG: hypothetical protein CSA60_00520 [Neptuniibacter caesariensis]|uniref:Uncharacterized protein n=1 Tax=Neptuniibacter caesariensis TaxID=207954 RepID=A0A2G6JPT3_NEPCE|nr:MAG: hypothetical protein CSA60_00520 [Neptuniibacter caesariensis]